MAVCELCGKVVDSTTTVKVAGTNMQACGVCKRLGKEVDPAPVGKSSHSFYKKRKQSVVLDVVPNYASIINAALSRKGLNLHQVAKALNIKESTLHKYSSGKLKPDEKSARIIQNFLEITLLEEREEVNPNEYLGSDEGSSENPSLGDMLRRKLEEKR